MSLLNQIANANFTKSQSAHGGRASAKMRAVQNWQNPKGTALTCELIAVGNGGDTFRYSDGVEVFRRWGSRDKISVRYA